MPKIHFQNLDSESPVPSFLRFQDLNIHSISGSPALTIGSDDSGWTVNAIEQVFSACEAISHLRYGAEAFLGETLIGSTEV